MKQNGAITKIEFNQEQIDLIKKTIAPNASNDELKLFLYQCQRTGLDPLTRQIYCIHRGGKMTIQTSIDGFRVIAERSGSYAGQDEPIWEEGTKTPVKCTVKVYRFSPDGQRYCAGVGVAYWSEYAQTSPMWSKMAHTMLAKCAEALALRKAFPQDLSGLYTADEMAQAEVTTQETGMEDISKTMPTIGEKQDLCNMIETTDLNVATRKAVFDKITNCVDYKTYNEIKFYLEDHQKEPVNPNQKDISKTVNKKANAA